MEGERGAVPGWHSEVKLRYDEHILSLSLSLCLSMGWMGIYDGCSVPIPSSSPSSPSSPSSYESLMYYFVIVIFVIIVVLLCFVVGKGYV